MLTLVFMVALQPVPGTARAVVKQMHSGQPVNNVFHFTRADGGTQFLSQADVDDIAERLDNLWKARFLINQTNDLTLASIEVTDLTNNVGAQATVTEPGTGGNASPSLPANVACCISWHTIMRYRGGHPRTYIAGIHRDNQLDPRHFVTAYRNIILGHANALRLEFEPDWPLCLVRRTVNNSTLQVPSRIVITGESVNPRMDSQRRRLGRV